MSESNDDDFGPPEEWPDIPKDYQAPLTRWARRIVPWLLPFVLIMAYFTRRIWYPWGVL